MPTSRTFDVSAALAVAAAMVVCQYFLQGRCRFGERCWNDHPRGGGGGGGGRSGYSAHQHQGTGRGGGGEWGSTNQRYTNVIQPSTFKSNAWGDSRDHGRGLFGSTDFRPSGNSSRNADFSQNRLSALLSSDNTADGYKDEEERLLECVVKDMEIWESSGQWIFSSYSPMKGKPNISGFSDISPEELHLEYYTCRENYNIQSYINSVQQLTAQWKNRLLQLKGLNASTRAALVSELKNKVTQSLPAFGFGGQITSNFGLPSSPVYSSSNSASSSSFKTSSSLVRESSGNSSAFGSFSAGGTSSAGASHSLGLGNQAAPSAASFSFKTSERTSGVGTSGFGDYSAVKSSSTTAFTAVGDFNAAAASPSHSSSALFGQTANTSGHKETATSLAVTNSTTSEKLFTPKSELSKEELEQFQAKRFTLGKIPLNPPPIDLLDI